MFHFRAVPAATDGVIDLIPVRTWPPEEDLHFGESQDYVITRHGSRREAGRINIRTGEGTGIYYFGHIGYHVDEPYRGNHFALHACRLVLPILQKLGKRTIVITADPDNPASRKTCEELGCRLESIVDVPVKYQREWELSQRKCRYVIDISRKEEGDGEK